MSNFLKHFYFFSKLTTNFVLLLIIVILGYIFWQSYNSNEDIAVKFDEKFDQYLYKIEENTAKLDLLNTVILESKQDIENLHGIIETNLFTEYQPQLDKLYKDNIVLQKKIDELSSQFSIQPSNIDNEAETDNNQRLINNIIHLIQIKYEAGLNVKQELILLDNINDKDFNKTYIEKLFILAEKQFLGMNNLEFEFSESMKNYLNEYFIKKNNNFFIKYLSNFVSIEPSNNSSYNNEIIENFTKIKIQLKNKDIKSALINLESINEHEIYFMQWIKQANMYLVFFETLERFSLQ